MMVEFRAVFVRFHTNGKYIQIVVGNEYHCPIDRIPGYCVIIILYDLSSVIGIIMLEINTY